ncbi:hypothetical protein [Peribacillus sp. AS_2]|uniref:hypothetical protein n=1 Tax=Peribacillus sp. AS_2 TaxID=2996755 RepID=UPI0022A6F952|nr:hypothetical protein [Peribacillus sp. AS_2]MCZ0873530.1 hypothetical protein [Peribacillus sp. AS_2]
MVIKNLSLMGMGFYLRGARLLRVWLQFFWFVKLEPLISTPGIRFPRAVREPLGSRFSSNISPVSLGVPIGLILNHDFKTRLDYSSCFFTVILIGWKKFATLLPNYWLAETPQPLGEEAWQTVGGKGADF